MATSRKTRIPASGGGGAEGWRSLAALFFAESSLKALVFVLCIAATFSTAAVERPSNDDFAEAIRLEGDSVNFDGGLTGATVEPWELTLPPPASVWWIWRAPLTGRTVIYLAERSGPPGVLSVFAENGESKPSQSSEISVVPFGIRAYSTFAAEAGKTYYFRLSGVLGTESYYSFRLVQNPKLPIIVESPRAEIVRVGENALFTVATISDRSSAPRIQWQFEGKDLPGETFPMLVLTNVSSLQVGQYRAIVSATNSLGMEIVRTSDPARLILWQAETVPPLLIHASAAQPEFVGVSLAEKLAPLYFVSWSSNLTDWTVDSTPQSAVTRLWKDSMGVRYFRAAWYEPLNPICSLQLRQIQFAQAIWAVNNNRNSGDPIREEDLVPYFKNGFPTCPEGGPYPKRCFNDVCSLGFLDTTPYCRIVGHYCVPSFQ